MSGLKAERVLDAVRVVTQQHNKAETQFRTLQNFQGALMSRKLLRIDLTCGDFVNRAVWL